MTVNFNELLDPNFWYTSAELRAFDGVRRHDVYNASADGSLFKKPHPDDDRAKLYALPPGDATQLFSEAPEPQDETASLEEEAEATVEPELSDDPEELLAELAGAEAEIEELQAHVNRVVAERDAANEELERQRKMREEVKVERDAACHERDVCKEQRKGFQNTITHLRGKLRQKEGDTSSTEEHDAIAQMQEAWSCLGTSFAEGNETIAEAVKDVLHSHQAELEEWERSEQKAKSKIAHLNAELEAAEAQLKKRNGAEEKFWLNWFEELHESTGLDDELEPHDLAEHIGNLTQAIGSIANAVGDRMENGPIGVANAVKRLRSNSKELEAKLDVLREERDHWQAEAVELRKPSPFPPRLTDAAWTVVLTHLSQRSIEERESTITALAEALRENYQGAA